MTDAPHIFRWDLDKTYLRTQFDTLRDLLKTALQGPAEKENVPGSAELIQALRQDAAGNAEVYFISGSPKQMRTVLTEKLALDGVEFDGFILKDNLRNILRGRFRAVKEQVGYKLPALLRARAHAQPLSGETLFGDDAERDAFIYAFYGELLARRIDASTLHEVLNIAGVYPDVQETIITALAAVPRCDPVERIIIHLDRKSPPVRFEAYGAKVVPVYNYFQAALVLYQDGRLRDETVVRIGQALLRQHGFNLKILARSCQDLVRRGALSSDSATALAEHDYEHDVESDFTHALLEASRLEKIRPNQREQTSVVDFPSLLKREQQRHRMEKARRSVTPF